ncbi:MAG: L-threonylcarbamoyladenylate synthase [Flavobacteriales bacterium]
MILEPLANQKTDFSNDLKQAADTLKAGGVILYPTDTVWGLGCDAGNQAAVDKLREIKGREDDKGMLVLLSDDGQLQRFVKKVPEVAWDLIDNVEKPTTIIYPQGYNMAAGVCAPDGSIGIRITKNEVCQFLVRRINRPLVSTSANFKGQPSANVYSDIDPKLIAMVDCVVDPKFAQSKSKESTLIKLGLTGQIKILRP